MSRRGFFAGILSLMAIGFARAESFSFSADRVESSLAAGKERTVLAGRARVTSGSLLITADRIELSGKNWNFLECKGKVVAVDSERGIKIESPVLSYDRKKKLSHMEGPSILEDRENKIVLKANWIENDGETETTFAQVSVRILKEGLACRSEYAYYRKNENSLELTGAPVAYKDGDEYRATRIVVNTESEEIKLEGEVSGKIESSTDKKDEPPSAPKGEAPKEPPSSSPGTPLPPSPVPSGASQPTAPGTVTPPTTAPGGGAPVSFLSRGGFLG